MPLPVGRVEPARSAVDVGALFDAHGRSVARCAERMLGPGPHVEDVVQEVFLVAHRRAEQLAQVESQKAWLLGVCLRTTQHYIRSKMRRRGLLDRLLQRDLPAPPTRPEVGVQRSEARALVRRALATLSADECAVFVLYELEELSGKEIAAALGIPEKTVWSRLARARQRFTTWADHWADQSGTRIIDEEPAARAQGGRHG